MGWCPMELGGGYSWVHRDATGGNRVVSLDRAGGVGLMQRFFDGGGR